MHLALTCRNRIYHFNPQPPRTGISDANTVGSRAWGAVKMSSGQAGSPTLRHFTTFSWHGILCCQMSPTVNGAPRRGPGDKLVQRNEHGLWCLKPWVQGPLYCWPLCASVSLFLQTKIMPSAQVSCGEEMNEPM